MNLIRNAKFRHQSQKFWGNSIKHNLLRFSFKKLKDSSIKTPSPPLYQCCGSVICPQHSLGVICRPINVDQRWGERKTFAKSGSVNIFCDWLLSRTMHLIVCTCVVLKAFHDSRRKRKGPSSNFTKFLRVNYRLFLKKLWFFWWFQWGKRLINLLEFA